MTDIEFNENGVPQYPKGHTGRLLVTLAAIDKLERPTATSVANLTGLSKGKIDDYVHALKAELGVTVTKEGPEYRIDNWGELLKKMGVRKCLTVPINGTNMESRSSR
jgi:hypothetical protein